ncbi:MAG: cytochrome b/b6 domain-containing protein [Micropepsaceae bacterium]
MQPGDTTAPPFAYTRARRAAHWLTLGLLVALYAVGWVLPGLKDPALWRFAMTAHQSLGLLVAIIGAVRLAAVLIKPGPAAPGVSRFAGWAARQVHVALCLLTIALPVSGWAFTSVVGGSIRFFWLIDIPPIAAENDALAERLLGVHIALGLTLIGVAVAHASAALFHALVLKDGVLARMIPALRRG